MYFSTTPSWCSTAVRRTSKYRASRLRTTSGSKVSPSAVEPLMSAKTIVTVRRLSDIYEQVNAPFGQFGMDTLTASTRAIKSSNEAVYNSIENAIESYTTERDTLASQIKAALDAAAFDGNAHLA